MEKIVKGQLTITFKRTLKGDYYIINFKVNDEPIKFRHINTEPPLKDGIGLIIFGGKVTILPKEQIEQNLPKPLIKGIGAFNTHDIKQELNMSYSEYDYNYVIKTPLSSIEEINKFIKFLVQSLTMNIINLFIDAGIDIELHATIKKEILSNQVEQEDIQF